MSLPHLERQPSASSRGLGPRLASWRQKPSATCRCLALTGDLGLAPSPKFTKQALANPGAMSAAAVRPGSACSVDRDCPGEGTSARCRRRTSHSSQVSCREFFRRRAHCWVPESAFASHPRAPSSRHPQPLLAGLGLPDSSEHLALSTLVLPGAWPSTKPGAVATLRMTNLPGGQSRGARR